MTSRASAARVSFRRFADLDAAYVNRDFQVHTDATDGHASVEEMLDRAGEIALGAMAFTEHVRRSTTYFEAFAARVRAARACVGLEVMVGIECKALDVEGTLDVSPEILGEAEIVLGSVHRFPMPDGRLSSAANFTLEAAAQRELELAVGLLRRAPLDVLAHPGGMCLRAFGTFPAEMMRELMVVSLERGVAVEINSSYLHDMSAFLELCGEVNPFVSIGSDAHTTKELGTCRDALRARGIGAC